MILGAAPSRLPLMAVTKGARIMMGRQWTLCANVPRTILKSEGIRCRRLSQLAAARLIPYFFNSNGSKGARNEEYTSCTKCADEKVMTLLRLKIIFFNEQMYQIRGFNVCAGCLK